MEESGETGGFQHCLFKHLGDAALLMVGGGLPASVCEVPGCTITNGLTEVQLAFADHRLGLYI